MATLGHNRVQVFFKESYPYVYGAIHIADGDPAGQQFENPFLVAKKREDGDHMFFGTVALTMTKIWAHLDRLASFAQLAETWLAKAGIGSVDGEGRLPDSALTDRIIEEQERLAEDVLLAVSVHVRVLSEIFPRKLSAAKVGVYDYEGKPVGEIELSDMANLLLHNRYVAIKEDHIVDLFSDRRFMTDRAQLGLRVSLREYEDAVRQALDGLTVGDLMAMLQERTRAVSSSSSVRDIVFLTQNLYTLGGLVASDDARKNPWFLEVVERVVRRNAKERGEKPGRGVPTRTTVLFRAPRFGWNRTCIGSRSG